jgi:hypothetical protein
MAKRGAAAIAYRGGLTGEWRVVEDQLTDADRAADDRHATDAEQAGADVRSFHDVDVRVIMVHL